MKEAIVVSREVTYRRQKPESKGQKMEPDGILLKIESSVHEVGKDKLEGRPKRREKRKKQRQKIVFENGEFRIATYAYKRRVNKIEKNIAGNKIDGEKPVFEKTRVVFPRSVNQEIKPERKIVKHAKTSELKQAGNTDIDQDTHGEEQTDKQKMGSSTIPKGVSDNEGEVNQDQGGSWKKRLDKLNNILLKKENKTGVEIQGQKPEDQERWPEFEEKVVFKEPEWKEKTQKEGDKRRFNLKGVREFLRIGRKKDNEEKTSGKPEANDEKIKSAEKIRIFLKSKSEEVKLKKVEKLENFLREKQNAINVKIQKTKEKYYPAMGEKIDKLGQGLINHPAATGAILSGLVGTGYVILVNGSVIPAEGAAPYYYMVRDIVEKAGGHLYIPYNGGVSSIYGSVIVGEGMRRVIQNDKIANVYNNIVKKYEGAKSTARRVLRTEKKVIDTNAESTEGKNKVSVGTRAKIMSIFRKTNKEEVK